MFNYHFITPESMKGLEPHSGGFKRLIERILSEGAIPAIPSPSAAVKFVLTMWNWKATSLPNGTEEIWVPRTEFITNRRSISLFGTEEDRQENA